MQQELSPALSRGAIDRHADWRGDHELLATLAADGKLVEAAGGKLRASETRLRLGSVGSVESVAYLGEADGTHYFSTLPPVDGANVDGEDWRSLREVGALLSDVEAGLATTAIALHNWHSTHSHCPRCGTPADIVQAGWVRRCPADGSLHFPRTDPAIIVAVVDASDRLLLARQTVWQDNQYSILAGFCEPGESLEQAVAREVLEEVSVTVDAVTYLGSQPWPFPASLMLGFAASGSGDITVDGEEIAEASWYSRADLAAACESGSVKLPPPVSIAHRLIQRWWGSDLPLEWLRV